MFGPEMMQQIDEIVLNQRRSDTSELRQNTNKDDGDAGQANQKRGWYSLFSGVRVFVCVCACLCVCVCVCVRLAVLVDVMTSSSLFFIFWNLEKEREKHETKKIRERD